MLAKHHVAIYTETFLFHHSWKKYQTVAANVSNSEKHAMCMLNDINCHCFQNLRIFINQKRHVQYAC